MAHFHVFDNDAEIELVDEDALATVAQHHDLTAAELDRLRVGWEYDFDGEESTSVDVKRRPCGATPRLETIISRLQFLLSTDAILNSMWDAAQEGELTDANLAHHLLGDAVLFNAVANLDDEDVKAHEQARLEILQEWQDKVAGIAPKGTGYFLPPKCQQEWVNSKERAEALLSDDSMAELEAWIQWSQRYLVPLRGKRDDRARTAPS